MSTTRTLWIAAGIAVAGLIAWQALFTGHSPEARRRVGAGSDAIVGLISEGEDVELAAHARAQGLTVFEFMAPW